MPRVLSLAAVACDVCAPTNPQIQPCREGSTDIQAKTILPLSSFPPTLTFLTTSGTVSYPMPKSPSTSCVPGAPIPHSLPGPAYTVSHTTSPPTLFTPLANSVLPSPVPITATLGPLTGISLLPLAQPLPTTAVNVFMSSPPALNASLLP